MAARLQGEVRADQAVSAGFGRGAHAAMRFHTTRHLAACLAFSALAATCSLTRVLAEEAPKSQSEVAGKVIDDPAVKAEVEAVFRTYEAAIVGNDVATLEALFRDDSRTIRSGAGENLYGMDAIRAFRRGRSPIGLARDLKGTVINTYGQTSLLR